MDTFELPRVRTELQKLLVIPLPTPHPEQANGEFARHRHFGDSTFPSHCQVQGIDAATARSNHGLCSDRSRNCARSAADLTPARTVTQNFLDLPHGLSPGRHPRSPSHGVVMPGDCPAVAAPVVGSPCGKHSAPSRTLFRWRTRRVRLQTGMLSGITTEWCLTSHRNRARLRPHSPPSSPQH